jgi:hypothetical protein
MKDLCDVLIMMFVFTIYEICGVLRFKWTLTKEIQVI